MKYVYAGFYYSQPNDYGASSSPGGTSYYTGYYGSDSRNYGSGSVGGDSRNYGSSVGADSRSSYGLYASSFGSGRAARDGPDPSRFRRAQSVSDFTPSSADRSYSSDNRAYNPAGSGGQFQSRFLDKVRARKSAYGDDQTSSTTSYKSRFLSSTSAADSGGSVSASASRHYSTRLNYSSTDE